MKTYMPVKLKSFFNQEMQKAKSYMRIGDMENGWKHLERAHVLGQPYPLEHTKVHWEMLSVSLRRGRVKEISGQIPRLLLGGLKSFTGTIPVGNTGGANVPPLMPMEIEKELQEIIKQNT